MFLKIDGDYVNLNHIDIVRPRTSKSGEARLDIYLASEADPVYILKDPAEILKATEVFAQLEIAQLAELAEHVREIRQLRDDERAEN